MWGTTTRRTRVGASKKSIPARGFAPFTRACHQLSLLPPGRAPRRRSGRSQWGCPARRPGRGSWCSVRHVIARSPRPRRLFLGAGAMFVGAHNGAVDHRVFVVGVCGEMLKNPLPDTAFGPTAEPQMHLCPLAETLGQIAPWHASTITVQHCLDEQPIV